MKNLNIIFAQTGRIDRVMPVNRESISIIPVETILCGEPHKAAAVLGDGTDKIVGKPVVYGQMIEFDILGRYL